MGMGSDLLSSLSQMLSLNPFDKLVQVAVCEQDQPVCTEPPVGLITDYSPSRLMDWSQLNSVEMRYSCCEL